MISHALCQQSGIPDRLIIINIHIAQLFPVHQNTNRQEVHTVLYSQEEFLDLKSPASVTATVGQCCTTASSTSTLNLFTGADSVPENQLSLTISQQLYTPLRSDINTIMWENVNIKISFNEYTTCCFFYQFNTFAGLEYLTRLFF